MVLKPLYTYKIMNTETDLAVLFFVTFCTHTKGKPIRIAFKVLGVLELTTN